MTTLTESAHLAAFAEAPSLEVYKYIQRLSGERWTKLQPEQMRILFQSGLLDAIASVHLYEQNWDEAIAITEKNIYDYTLREKVADAVIAHRPDWVIRISITIMPHSPALKAGEWAFAK